MRKCTCAMSEMPYKVALSQHEEHCMARQGRPNLADMLKLAQKLHDARVIPSCMTCDNFDEAGVKCKLVQITPPPRIIAYGCEGWIEALPF